MPKNRIILRVCAACSRGFLGETHQVRSGFGRYCSRRCVMERHGASPSIRLSARTQRGPGCWEWTGGRVAAGYGTIRVAGRTVLTHRLAWEVAYGPIPPGMAVCHRCDNPPCVRPDHLFLGTQSENSRDMIAKGRHHNARLSAEQVRFIRTRYAHGDSTQVDLAKQFGITIYAIWAVIHRKSWKHLDPQQ